HALVDLSQHADITGPILKQFHLNPKIIRTVNTNRSVASYKSGLGWLFQHIKNLVKKKFENDGFIAQKGGIALIHGDTASTLIGMLYAKKLRAKVGLVEAGLTSGRLLNPFPEEITRRICQKYADILFCPGELATTVLHNKRVKGKVINTIYNTGRDALSLILKAGKPEMPSGSYPVVCTLHRFETITNKKTLSKLVEHVIDLSALLGKTLFLLHEPTKRFLTRFKLLQKLELCENIVIHELLPYNEFMRAVISAQYIITDGGSIQEEAAYLGKSCLILRKNTERADGLGKTAFL